MGFLQGPKGLLSSTIATALAEYFVVNVDHIESNLLNDTKIVLNDVRLKPQRSSIPVNTFGKRTNIYVTGFIREVSFTWSWESVTSESKSWVKDAALQIKGCKFKAQLTGEDIDDGANETQDSSADTNQEEWSSELHSKVDQQTEETITNEGGMYAYLKKQVEMVVDALTMSIVDFEMTIEMPSPTVVEQSATLSNISIFEDPQEPGSIEIVELEPPEASHLDANKEMDQYTVSFVVGSSELKIVSLGRYFSGNGETLKENIFLTSLFVNVVETFHQATSTNESSTPSRRLVCKTYPLLDPFSYSLEVMRTHGKRFDGVGRGVIVKGQQQEVGGDTAVPSTTTRGRDPRKGISFRLARPQMEGFGQLSGLILAPREDNEDTEPIISESSNNNEALLVGDVSVFDFCIDGAAVEFMGDIMALTGIDLRYMADGTDFKATVDVFRYAELPKEKKKRGISMTLLDITASVRPSVEVTIGSVSTLYVPDIIEMRAPMKNVRAHLIGETWSFHIDSFEGSLPAPEGGLDGKDSSKINPSHDPTFVVPFPMSCNVKRIKLTKDDDKETEMSISDIELLMNPRIEAGLSSTDVACTVSSLESKLVCATNINTCMAISATEADADTIRNFALSLDSMSVTAGYSIQDWIQTFRIGGRWRRRGQNKKTSYPLVPFASVAPLKIRIAYNALSVVSVKETTFRVKAYKGKETTTVKNLIDFYVAQCLARTPNFLQNAELLGINVEDASAFSVGAALGFASPIGPFAGVAAVVGVDAVRGSIEAGKRGRNAKEDDTGNMIDFFRGIGYSATEATKTGKLRRGAIDAQRGNIVDWVVGATVNTTDYIGKNKDTIGSAGGAGAGVLFGTLLGGPVGAVIGGMVGGMTTGTAIRRIDKRIQTVKKRKEEKYEDARLKSGQLALDS